MADNTFVDNGITYEIRRTARRFGSITMSIQPDLTVRVSAHKRMPMIQIKWLLKSKIDWITKQIEVVRARNANKKERFRDGEKALYLGVEYPVTVQQTDVLTTKIELGEQGFVISLPRHYDAARVENVVKKTFEKWYAAQGKRLLTEKANEYAARLGYEYNGLKIKHVSTIWGSCSRDQNLSFNIKLMLAPEPVIDYVVAHEVCHLKHKHHQESFWECVSRFDPEHKAHRRWLRANAEEIELE